MAEKREFPHIQLKLTRQGRAQLAGGPREKNPRTDANTNNRSGHGGRLQNSRLAIIADWRDTREKREEEDKPSLPDVVPLILQTDPKAFDADILKGFGIEVIAELEDGYIIGASVNDPDLTKLQEKIEKFINQDPNDGKKVPEIWELIDGTQRPEYILSQELLEQWSRISDEQIYTVDVGVACLGEKSKFTNPPQRKDCKSDESFFKKTKGWMDKRDITYQEWDNFKSEREDALIEFVENYQGKILSNVDGTISKYAELPDSFSCRISISGKGLRDLVLNFPFIFEVVEPDQFAELVVRQGLSEGDDPPFQLEPPASNAPKVCVIDSGIQERHPLLRAAIDENSSKSWVPGEIDQTADYVSKGGHGTRVAGAVLYPRTVPRTGQQQAFCWIQNAKVLDAKCQMPKRLFPPNLLGEIVDFYHGQTGTRIFNHSIAAAVPCRTIYMSAWASAIDELTWQNDILFIVAAGNLDAYRPYGVTSLTRLSVKDHLAANRPYPDYLLEDSCRIGNPAQSLMALTVGSIARESYRLPPYSSFAEEADRPSAFSCSGLGIWETIKPEVVEYGGDLVTDGGNPPNITSPKEVCPELVRSTLGGGSPLASDGFGTSFAAPKVSHIAAYLAAELPNESCLLYRALIVQSARWPEWALESAAAWAANKQGAKDMNPKDIISLMGYGIPSLARALENTPKRITLITRGNNKIQARQAHIYQVKLPEIMQSQGEEIEFLLEITLSYKAQPRRTRRHRRKYLSTWLDWDCSKRGEDPDSFLARILKDYDAPENAEKGEGIFSWTLGKQNNYGQIRDISRGAGTIQKDWAYVKSHQLRKAFCIGVVGHEGWNNDSGAEVPYSLVVSFEATQADVPIYASVVKAQQRVETKVAPEIQV